MNFESGFCKNLSRVLKQDRLSQEVIKKEETFVLINY